MVYCLNVKYHEIYVKLYGKYFDQCSMKVPFALFMSKLKCQLSGKH